MSKAHQPKRPRDVSQLAKLIVDISTGQAEDTGPIQTSEKAAKRGEARAAKLTPERRREIARKAARERWKKAK
jgi:hypothetical protein